MDDYPANNRSEIKVEVEFNYETYCITNLWERVESPIIQIAVL